MLGLPNDENVGLIMKWRLYRKEYMPMRLPAGAAKEAAADNRAAPVIR